MNQATVDQAFNEAFWQYWYETDKIGLIYEVFLNKWKYRDLPEPIDVKKAAKRMRKIIKRLKKQK